MKAVISAAARKDLLDAAAWIAKTNPLAARALRGSIVEAAIVLGDSPNIGFERIDLIDSPVRFWILRGFPYIIVYDSELRPPLILRVLYGARDLPEVLAEL